MTDGVGHPVPDPTRPDKYALPLPLQINSVCAAPFEQQRGQR